MKTPTLTVICAAMLWSCVAAPRPKGEWHATSAADLETEPVTEAVSRPTAPAPISRVAPPRRPVIARQAPRPSTVIRRVVAAPAPPVDFTLDAPSIEITAPPALPTRQEALHVVAGDPLLTPLPVVSASRATPRARLLEHENAMRQCLRAAHGRSMRLRVAINRNGVLTGVHTEGEPAAASCVRAIVRDTRIGPQPADTTVSLHLEAT